MRFHKIVINKENLKFANKKIIENDISYDDKGVYIILNKDLEVIYVGRTANFRQRMNCHVSPRITNVADKLIRPMRYDEFSSVIPRGEAQYFGFIAEEDSEKRTYLEYLLVTVLKPKYNYDEKYSR